MAEYKRVALLVLVMAVVAAAATAVATGMLYKTAFERERLQLIDSAQGQARLIEAIAQFDRVYTRDYPDGPEAATLSQVVAAYEKQPAVGETSELTIARLNGDEIEFLMRHRHARSGRPDPIPFTSTLAEPTRRALKGQSGSMVGIDYHGEQVLAAYEPVSELNLGVVSKVDIAEIRAPFVRAGLMASAVTILLIGLGTILFIRLTNPMIEALRHRQEALELILASTEEGIFGMDLEGRCMFANRSAVKLLGYRDQQELLSRDIHELIHHSRADGQPWPKEECGVYKALNAKAAVHRDEETMWRADGSSFFAEYHSHPIRRDGVVIGAVVTFFDITERKERELELVHAQKMEVLGQLTGGIAHDFNNLLTIILGNLRLLEDAGTAATDEARHEIIEDAISAARDSADLTRRLLAFSRKQTLKTQWADVNAFLREHGPFFRRVIGEDIELDMRSCRGPLSIRTDLQQLQSAMLNLAINAADAMPAGGTLSIGTKRLEIAADGNGDGLAPGSYAVIEVEDTGEGMPDDVARHAVEPFFTTKQPGHGSGLGLSMVYGFAKQSGGALRIRSEPGQGTLVSLLIPETVAPAMPESTDSPLPIGHIGRDGATILVVEDEPRLRRYACRSLAAMGLQVFDTGEVAEARRLLEDKPAIDLLFSDIVMPGDMNGRALARWAVERRPGLKVLLTTGFSGSIGHDDGAAESEFPVLEKPYTAERLCAEIDVLLNAESLETIPAPPAT